LIKKENAPENNSELLKGKELRKYIQEFIKKEFRLFNLLKNNFYSDDYFSCYIIRGQFLEELVDALENTTLIVSLMHQHIIMIEFISYILNLRENAQFEKVLASGKRIDLVAKNINYELKTGQNIAIFQSSMPESVKTLVKKYLGEIKASINVKDVWWLVFFNKLNINEIKELKKKIETKQINKAGFSKYYLVIIEMTAHNENVNSGAVDTVLDHIDGKVRDTMREVLSDDGLDEEDEGFLVPVKNIWIVDHLRDTLKEREALLEEKDKVIEKHEALLEEKDKVIEEKDKVIEELQRKLKEK